MDWLDTELAALKDELRHRVAAVSERERALGKWEHELERREARLDKQHESLRRRRREVLMRLLRLRGRGTPIRLPEVSPNGAAPQLDEALQQTVAEAAVPEPAHAAAAADKPARRSTKPPAAPPAES
jgi:hypothetical protein